MVPAARKHGQPPDQQRATTDALATLFDRLGLPRYADTCRGPTTDRVRAAYAVDDTTGFTAYRKALTGGRVEPPDLPDLLIWGGVLGVEEHAAFWAVADHLEQSINAGVYTPGGPGWRTAAVRVAAQVLTVPRLDLHGGTYLDRIHAERRDRWAHSLGPARTALTRQVLPLLVDDPPVPDDADDHLAQIRWFLDLSAGDVPSSPSTTRCPGHCSPRPATGSTGWSWANRRPRRTGYPRPTTFAASSTNSAPPAAAAAGCCSPPAAAAAGCCSPPADSTCSTPTPRPCGPP